ncbi:hypothetical protein GCM10007856_50240 [Azospirillum oryzae]|nr:hypothetical protein GCM10007856_50240 [Azospirillum oryzae]
MRVLFGYSVPFGVILARSSGLDQMGGYSGCRTGYGAGFGAGFGAGCGVIPRRHGGGAGRRKERE